MTGAASSARETRGSAPPSLKAKLHEGPSDGGIADLARQVCAGVGSLQRDVEVLSRENAILREEIVRLGGASADAIVEAKMLSIGRRPSRVLLGGEEKFAGAVDYGIRSEEQRDTYQMPLISTVSVPASRRSEPRMSVNRRWSPPSNLCLRTLDYFIACTLLVNMVVAGIEPDADSVARGYIDIAFTAVYTFEMVIKLVFHGCLIHFVKGQDARWNVFDGLLVALGIVDVTTDFGEGSTKQYASTLRCIRLTKLFRVVRLVRLPMFQELYHIFRRFSAGMGSLKGSMILLGISVWCVSVVCTQLIGLDDTPDSQRFPDFQNQRDFLFSNVFNSFFTVFRVMNGDSDMLNGDPLVPAFANVYGVPFAIGYILFVVVIHYGMLNLIMALFVESTLRTSDDEDSRLSYVRFVTLSEGGQPAAHVSSRT
eukprot:TRINITY_DN17354_c0_g4_i1.p1 TRINITY_DN17354_c0_g4~~TRINITY_DN17354_c0_g4_i1.p1  ORF type:complete len:443 (+),score=57.56 TRINITY_DN17354_c0_g4_i1:56-1330(+)